MTCLSFLFLGFCAGIAKKYHKLVDTIKTVLNMKANSNETEHKVVSGPIKGHTENVTSSWRSNGKNMHAKLATLLLALLD